MIYGVIHGVKKRTRWWGILVILVLAAALRCHGLDWDGALGAHPDERYLVGVAEGLRWPDRLNPFDVAPDLAYGHLPVYVLALLMALISGVDPLLLGRALAVLFDLGTVALTFGLGWKVYSERTGLLGAALVALTVLHVQQAHFYTVDVLLACCALSALFFAACLTEGGRRRDAWLAGLCAGLALGCKFSAALLVLPLGAACVVAPGERRERWRYALQVGAGTLVAFGLTNPFALLRFSAFWHNVAREAAIARGLLDVPYTRQFHGTWPYVYPVWQQVGWGMGLPFGGAAFCGLAYAVWRAVRQPPRPAEWVLLGWMVPGFAFVGALYAKYPRYLLPLAPLLALYAARWLFEARRSRLFRRSLPCCSLLIVLLVGSFLHCVAFVGIYCSSHPWLVASDWVREHVSAGAVIAVEQWDHPLPVGGADEYDLRELPVFDEDAPQDQAIEKWAAMEATLAEADYVVISSRRGYATLPRWPERYPLTADYYRRLFTGELGFRSVACFGSAPRLGPLAIADDPTEGLDFSLPEVCRPDAPFVLRIWRLDESFVVYDHPQVVIFRRAED